MGDSELGIEGEQVECGWCMTGAGGCNDILLSARFALGVIRDQIGLD